MQFTRDELLILKNEIDNDPQYSGKTDGQVVGLLTTQRTLGLHVPSIKATAVIDALGSTAFALIVDNSKTAPGTLGRSDSICFLQLLALPEELNVDTGGAARNVLNSLVEANILTAEDRANVIQAATKPIVKSRLEELIGRGNFIEPGEVDSARRVI